MNKKYTPESIPSLQETIRELTIKTDRINSSLHTLKWKMTDYQVEKERIRKKIFKIKEMIEKLETPELIIGSKKK